MKILLAVDGSRHSLRATRYVIAQARAYRARPTVELVHVCRPVPRLPNMSVVVGARQIRRYYEQQGAAALSKARKLLAAGGIPYAARTLVGEVAGTIVRQARRARCDAIVIGTRGMTAAANFVLGSIATKVLHAARRPVVLVK